MGIFSDWWTRRQDRIVRDRDEADELKGLRMLVTRYVEAKEEEAWKCIKALESGEFPRASLSHDLWQENRTRYALLCQDVEENFAASRFFEALHGFRLELDGFREFLRQNVAAGSPLLVPSRGVTGAYASGFKARFSEQLRLVNKTARDYKEYRVARTKATSGE